MIDLLLSFENCAPFDAFWDGKNHSPIMRFFWFDDVTFIFLWKSFTVCTTLPNLRFYLHIFLKIILRFYYCKILPCDFSENHSSFLRFFPILRLYILKHESHSRILRFFQSYSFTLWFLENNYPILPMLRLNSFEVIVTTFLCAKTFHFFAHAQRRLRYI